MALTQNTFRSTGFHLTDNYLPPEYCAAILASIALYRRLHGDVMVERDGGERPLRYSVIDGVRVKLHLSEIMNIYGQVNELVDSISGLSLVPLEKFNLAQSFQRLFARSIRPAEILSFA